MEGGVPRWVYYPGPVPPVYTLPPYTTWVHRHHTSPPRHHVQQEQEYPGQSYPAFSEGRGVPRAELSRSSRGGESTLGRVIRAYYARAKNREYSGRKNSGYSTLGVLADGGILVILLLKTRRVLAGFLPYSS